MSPNKLYNAMASAMTHTLCYRKSALPRQAEPNHEELVCIACSLKFNYGDVMINSAQSALPFPCIISRSKRLCVHAWPALECVCVYLAARMASPVTL